MENSLTIDPHKIQSFDGRRELAIPGDPSATIEFAVAHWLFIAKESIALRGKFCVALSGGSTPKAIFKALAKNSSIDWEKVWVFWSDERAVLPSDPDSNYQMAKETGLLNRVPAAQIFRMEAESEIATHAKQYELLIQKHVGSALFDLVMLGIGEDGHTASLFPHTQALSETEKLVTANYVAVKKSWRMTLSFSCINQSRHCVIYALGASKQAVVKEVLYDLEPFCWPASRVGTSHCKCLWILDKESAFLLLHSRIK